MFRAVHPARWAGLRNVRAVGAPGTPGWLFTAMDNLAARIAANRPGRPNGPPSLSPGHRPGYTVPIVSAPQRGAIPAMPAPRAIKQPPASRHLRLPASDHQQTALNCVAADVRRLRYPRAVLHPNHHELPLPIILIPRSLGGRSARIPLKIFDRNSRVRFDRCMIAARLQKSPVQDLMHNQLLNHS